MKKSQLEILLSKLKRPENPKVELEQYRTPSGIASDILNLIKVSGDLKGKIMDLGCGIGTFAIGSAVLDEQSKGIDIDREIIEISRKNKSLVEREIERELQVEFEVKAIKNVEEKANLVVMNPPFGLQSKESDLKFLKKAFEISDVVYSLHHSTTQNEKFLKKFASSHDFLINKIKTYNFSINKIFFFHKRDKYFIKADLYRLKKENSNV